MLKTRYVVETFGPRCRVVLDLDGLIMLVDTFATQAQALAYARNLAFVHAGTVEVR